MNHTVSTQGERWREGDGKWDWRDDEGEREGRGTGGIKGRGE